MSLRIYTLFLLIFSFLLFSDVHSKGFKFKSYKSLYKKSTLDHSYNKVSKPKSQKPVFQSQWFKWLIGGMIFGAFLSFLMGYGFHFGVPGLLEILIIGVIAFYLYKVFTTKKGRLSSGV